MEEELDGLLGPSWPACDTCSPYRVYCDSGMVPVDPAAYRDLESKIDKIEMTPPDWVDRL